MTCENGTIAHCKVYNLDGTCQVADNGYQINPSGNAVTPVPGAIVCPQNTKMLKYVIIDNECVAVDINCLYNLDDGYCYWCITGYYSSNGQCYSSTPSNNGGSSGSTGTQTITCASNQYLVGVNCINFPSNCNSFNSISKICSSCNNGYILYNNMCVTTVVCPSGTYSTGTSCVPIDPNCVIFDFQTLNCDLCITGYHSQGPNCFSKA